MSATLDTLARLFNQHGVRWIVVGGWAAAIHGAARAPRDIDILYARDHDNMCRLREALRPWQPDLRGDPPDMPMNFALTTDWGNLDFMGAVDGGGSYEQVLPFTEEITLRDGTLRVVTLEKLIHLTRAAGRAKDLKVLSELQDLFQRRRLRASKEQP